VGNVNLDTTEAGMATKRVQGIVAKPVWIQRHDLKPLVNEIGTQCTSQISCAAGNRDAFNLLCHDVLLKYFPFTLSE